MKGLTNENNIECFLIIRAVVSMVCYGLIFNSAHIGSNVYINVILIGLVNIPSSLLPQILLDKAWVGRRRGNIFFMILLGICMLLLLLIPDGKYKKIT